MIQAIEQEWPSWKHDDGMSRGCGRCHGDSYLQIGDRYRVIDDVVGTKTNRLLLHRHITPILLL
jgi:hypothetical protein